MRIHGAQVPRHFRLDDDDNDDNNPSNIPVRQTSHAPALIRSLPFVVSSRFQSFCQRIWGHKARLQRAADFRQSPARRRTILPQFPVVPKKSPATQFTR